MRVAIPALYPLPAHAIDHVDILSRALTKQDIEVLVARLRAIVSSVIVPNNMGL